MSNEQNFSENDQKLHHTVFAHLLEGALGELMTAFDESVQVYEEDERYMELFLRLSALMDLLMDLISDMIDALPGMLSKEEAEENVSQLFRSFAVMNGLPANVFLPDDEPVH